jgi:hypothetical protein
MIGKKKMTLKLASFIVDITPPIGFPLAYGVNRKVDSPTYIRGIILNDGAKSVIFASFDVIGIGGDVYLYFRKLIAKSAGVSNTHVFIHSVHQHDSIQLGNENPKDGKVKSFQKSISSRLRLAVGKAVKDGWRDIGKICTAEKRMSGLASNRRLIGKDGKVCAMRYSMTYDREMQSEPTGLIDPIIRTVAFKSTNGKVIVAMHFYASHPMTAYKRNMAGADVPGLAIDYAAKHYGKDTLNIYFNGCGGNITFGKYAINPPEKSLKVLGERLGRGIVSNLERLEDAATGKIKIKRAVFEVPFRKTIDRGKIYKDFPDDKVVDGIVKCYNTLRTKWNKWERAEISRISIGDDVHILSMPGETVVEYQLYAQSLLPEKFLACAAYSNYIYDYIPTAAMFDEGGYEPNVGSFTTPDVEKNYKEAICEVLKDM